jgi:hypothetical protein
MIKFKKTYYFMLIIHTFNVLYCCVCILNEHLKKCFLLLCIFNNFNDTFFQIINYSGVNNSIKGRQKELIENSNEEAHILIGGGSSFTI